MKLALGEEVTVVQSADRSTKGLRGKLVDESMKTICLYRNGKSVIVPKKGTAILIERSGDVLICDDMIGRLEERLGKGSAY